MSFLPKCTTSRLRGHSIHSALLVMLVALYLGLSACGGGDDDSGGGGSPIVDPPLGGGGGGDDHGDSPGNATRIYPGDNQSGRLLFGVQF